MLSKFLLLPSLFKFMKPTQIRSYGSNYIQKCSVNAEHLLENEKRSSLLAILGGKPLRSDRH